MTSFSERVRFAPPMPRVRTLTAVRSRPLGFPLNLPMMKIFPEGLRTLHASRIVKRGLLTTLRIKFRIHPGDGHARRWGGEGKRDGAIMKEAGLNQPPTANTAKLQPTVWTLAD